jgi:hypothetical protein
MGSRNLVADPDAPVDVAVVAHRSSDAGSPGSKLDEECVVMMQSWAVEEIIGELRFSGSEVGGGSRARVGWGGRDDPDHPS